MNSKNNVHELLSGFFAETLTSTQKSDLYHYLIDSCYKEVIFDWLQEQWANGLWQTGSEIPSDQMLEKIRMEIENHSIISSQQPAEQKISINREAKSRILRVSRFFLRYAAILLVAFGLSWVIWKAITKPADRDIIAEKSLQYNEIVVPYGSKSKVILPDNSTVWLNAGAQLKYPVNFNDNQRHVYLVGEGFFEVVKDSRHPFIVQSKSMNITVLGTKFNVMAHADDPFIETTLVEGSVEIQWLQDESDKQSNASLKPGQKLTLRKENEQYILQDIQEAGFSIAWLENKLVFAKERFGDAKIKLERWYGVTIEINDREISDYQITGTFENQTLEQAMQALSMAVSCKFKIDKNMVIVSK